MNFSKQFIRKIIYIFAIAVLLIPLSFVGRPSTRDKDNAINDSGGVLASMRDEEDLSLSGLSQIDPAGETMKLASLGLRGLAVNILWMQAMDSKDKKKWDDMSATLNTLVKLQPNFVKVWEYQAHNIAYNVSVEFDDYEYRYQWVKNGVSFLTEGIPANRRDHRIVDSLGWFSGHKFGEADERVQFRRMFRFDEQFHNKMGEYVNVSNLTAVEHPDNWLLAHEWYKKSEDMVELGVDGDEVKLRRKEMIFYNNKPAQLRNLMLSLQAEQRIEKEYAQRTWGMAHEEWMDYGRRDLNEAIGGLKYNLEGLNQSLEDMQRLRVELDELVPGVRNRLRQEAIQKATTLNILSPQQNEVLKMSLDELSDEQRQIVREAEAILFDQNKRLEFEIAEQATRKDEDRAKNLANDIYSIMGRMRSSDRDRSVINYNHWKYRTMAERDGTAVSARQALFDASELTRKSILDNYDEVNPVTNERQSNLGAIQEYENSFTLWAEVLEKYPSLKDGPLAENIIDELLDYESIRQTAGLVPYIRNHPLQDFIDFRISLGKNDGGLLSSVQVKQFLDRVESASVSSEMTPRPNIDFQLD